MKLLLIHSQEPHGPLQQCVDVSSNADTGGLAIARGALPLLWEGCDSEHDDVCLSRERAGLDSLPWESRALLTSLRNQLPEVRRSRQRGLLNHIEASLFGC